MRAFKLIVAGLFAALAAAVAIVAGLFAAAVVAAIGLAVYLSRRLLGRPPAATPREPGSPRVRPVSDADAIEVTATEVPSAAASSEDSANRQALPPGT